MSYLRINNPNEAQEDFRCWNNTKCKASFALASFDYFQLGSSKDTLVLWLESSIDRLIFGPLLGSILSIKTKKDQ